ncbi:hypothetical protein N7474_000523 [Penicillium riverlandense]|uniref:uncharacterized protein n=1 Tax=Penicillium riverlandense TaxID=1903569 RepID=UPI002546C112|nr:uncharacterized protein N7474_000523 [Penicillium riverlandense]KAJ5832212.1 hypothetical protein N7474_000523 [Penicillium riverlandense]
MESVYPDREQPENHIARLDGDTRAVPSTPSYGIDSPLGLLASSILAPLYVYASRKGKFEVWDRLLDELPSEILTAPALDIGCGRGLVLLKIAQRKKKLQATVPPVYGVDLFITGDQSGNAPEATYDNAASLQLTDYTVLHTADFTRLPFRDGVMSLITASLSIHNADKASREQAMHEAARVLRPGGFLVILELGGYIAQYRKVLESAGWSEIETSWAGLQVMFGAWPCQILKARKPGPDRSSGQ